MKTVYNLCRTVIRLAAALLLTSLFLSLLLTGLPRQTQELANKIPDSPFFRYEEIGNYLGKVTFLGISFEINLTSAQTVLDKLNDSLEEKKGAFPELLRKGAMGFCDVIIDTFSRLREGLRK